MRSAGVAAMAGGPASPGSLEVADRHGMSLEDHRSSPLTPALADWANLILTMSASHLGGVALVGGGERASVITEFAAGLEADAEPAARTQVPDGVPDPFGGDISEYEDTYRALESLVERVLDRLSPVIAP